MRCKIDQKDIKIQNGRPPVKSINDSLKVKIGKPPKSKNEK